MLGGGDRSERIGVKGRGTEEGNRCEGVRENKREGGGRNPLTCMTEMMSPLCITNWLRLADLL